MLGRNHNRDNNNKKGGVVLGRNHNRDNNNNNNNINFFLSLAISVCVILFVCMFVCWKGKTTKFSFINDTSNVIFQNISRE